MIREQIELSSPTQNNTVNTGYTNSNNAGSDHIKKSSKISYIKNLERLLSTS